MSTAMKIALAVLVAAAVAAALVVFTETKKADGASGRTIGAMSWV